ncbi:ParB/RepB/Spo0J family partition protein [Roseateles microcysteis]|uniref:ParB/RepB/Spo0J family partition protein n=1 Tax=Roseateles microcysteis TaxID=3119057 RepID=UPI002FE5C916
MNTATHAVADLAAVKLVPLSLITTHEQIRTRNGFDKESLRQLAESIQQYGVLQPIVIRRDPEADEGFIVLYGHRRTAAARLAKLERIPAMIVDQEPVAITEVQLAENLQREGLNLADTADGVRKLFNVYKKPAEVAKRVNKSPAWVSKHLALTSPSFDSRVRTLIDSDAVNDVEILHTLNQIAKSKNEDAPRVLNALLTRAMNEQLARADVRASLAKLKADPVDEAAAEQADDEGTDESEEQTELFNKVQLDLSPEQFRKLQALGGHDWIREQIDGAEV